MLMQRHVSFLREARRGIRSAEQLLKLAAGLEPRVLLTAAARIRSSMICTVSAILSYEAMMGRIPMAGLDNPLPLFKARMSRRYRFSRDYTAVIDEIGGLLDEHRESPMEFVRSGRLVITGQEMRLTVIDPKDIEGFIAKAKIFIQEAEAMLGHD
jgi:hypothetical protein